MAISFSLKMKSKNSPLVDTSTADFFWKRKEHKTNVSYFKQKVDRLVQSIMPFTGCPSGKEPSLRDEFCLLNHAAAFTYKIPVNVKATSMILKSKCIVIWRYGMIVTMVRPFREEKCCELNDFQFVFSLEHVWLVIFHLNSDRNKVIRASVRTRNSTSGTTLIREKNVRIWFSIRF